MEQAQPVGRNAQAVKYDILTALMVLHAHDSSTPGRLAGRLALLLTARYSWAKGSFACGVRELARLWGVTERTAKREMAAMRGLGWIALRRAAARGRVAEHSVALDVLFRASRPYWHAVGPDFVARLGAGRSEESPPARDNVVPLAPTLSEAPTGPETLTLWGLASGELYRSDPAVHRAWFAKLTEVGRDGAALELMAPSPFVARYVETHFIGRILAAVSQHDPRIIAVSIQSAP